MKIGIYNEPRDGGIGGSEISVAVLAEALANQHDVEIIHHKSYLTRERLAEISGTDLSGVQLRETPGEVYSFGTGRFPLERYRQARSWHASLTEPYDLFINFTHGIPPFCHSAVGALVVLFPFALHPRSAVLRETGSINDPSALERLKLAYHEWEWRRRVATYQIKTTISRYSQRWTSKRWDIDCDVIYPPVDTRLRPRAKRNIILSVGRFSTFGHSKKHLEMLAGWDRLHAPTFWKYFSIGGVSDNPDDLEYLGTVRRRARNGATILCNIDRNRLFGLYEQAKIFWHAAGFGDDQNLPELSEHFGVTTVEAMCAGCVPVVVNRGGQPEIVEHGVSGFVWNSIDELTKYTQLLMADERLRLRMSRAARTRALAFSRAKFLDNFISLLRSRISI